VPQVPPTHAIPPPHWLLAVHAVQTPPMQARPCGFWGIGTSLHSAKLEQGPHVPLLHTCPIGQPMKLQEVELLGEQIPDEQVSGGVQSVSTVQVHCIPLCVAAHVAVGPHWPSEVQTTQVFPAQTWPGWHWLLDTQVGQPPVHSVQTRSASHIPNPVMQ
jgi:hypothetical protein